MNSMQLVGLNIKWYRYKFNMTKEELSKKTKFKVSYISKIEKGIIDLTVDNLDLLANVFSIEPILLLNEETALKAKKLKQ